VQGSTQTVQQVSVRVLKQAPVPSVLYDMDMGVPPLCHARHGAGHADVGRKMIKLMKLIAMMILSPPQRLNQRISLQHVI
jgi:hypothetical protein